jgi:hypothetical protein
MLNIFNQSKTPWTLKEVGKTISFSKTKEYNRDKNNPTKKIKKSANILVYKSLFDENESMDSLTLTINKCVSMDTMQTIVTKNTSIYFNHKAYSPYVAESTERNMKDVFLVTLQLRGKQVIEISSTDVFLLEGFVLGGDLTVIASLNDFKQSFFITLLDNSTKKITNYVFGRDGEGKPFMDTYEDDYEDPENETKFILKRFRPAKPTNAILVHNKDLDALKTTLGDNFEKHNVQVFLKNTLEEKIEALLAEKYTAVTLFVNTPRITDDVVTKFYDPIRQNSNRFKLWFDLLSNGKVVKTKY